MTLISDALRKERKNGDRGTDPSGDPAVAAAPHPFPEIPSRGSRRKVAFFATVFIGLAIGARWVGAPKNATIRRDRPLETPAPAVAMRFTDSQPFAGGKSGRGSGAPPPPPVVRTKKPTMVAEASDFPGNGAKERNATGGEIPVPVSQSLTHSTGMGMNLLAKTVGDQIEELDIHGVRTGAYGARALIQGRLVSQGDPISLNGQSYVFRGLQGRELLFEDSQGAIHRRPIFPDPPIPDPAVK